MGIGFNSLFIGIGSAILEMSLPGGSYRPSFNSLFIGIGSAIRWRWSMLPSSPSRFNSLFIGIGSAMRYTDEVIEERRVSIPFSSG